MIAVLAHHKVNVICMMVIYNEINDNAEVFLEHSKL